MEIDSSVVGTKLIGLEREISWRQTTNYAAAIGDMNPVYMDDQRPGGIFAPPMFAVAVTWPMVADLSGQLDGRISPEVLNTMVHAGEHIIFHRLIRPSDHLLLSGEVAAVIPGRSGTLVFVRIDAADKKGDPVFTEYTGAMLRGVKCVDGGACMENMPTTAELVPQAELIWESESHISKQSPYVYDACSDIIFPIHTSPAFAAFVGLPGILLQGTATLAMAARDLVDRECGGDPGLMKELACRFTGMVFPGHTIKVQLLQKEKVGKSTNLRFRVLNGKGDEALGSGFMKLGENK